MQGSILTDLGAAINRYFAWMASGSPLRYVFGLGGPLLVLIVFYMLVFGGGDEPEELAVVTSTPNPAAAATDADDTPQPAGSSVAASESATPSTANGSPTAASTSTTPRATVAPGGTYVVQSGDTLGAICAANVPSMSVTECVEAIVQLNELESAGSLQIDQQLTLPGGSVTPRAGGTSTPPPATTTQPTSVTPTP